MSKENFWIEVEMESETTAAAIQKAMSQCETVRLWAYQEMREKWDISSGIAKSSDLLAALTLFVRQEGLDTVQRYSLVTAVNQVVSEFNSRLLENRETAPIGEVRVITLPYPPQPTPYAQQLTIQSRAVWGRYLAQYGRISTVYGGVYLLGDWQIVLIEQSRSLEISERLLSYLWYAATLEYEGKRWRLCFHAHRPTSVNGRKRKQEGKRRDDHNLV